MQTKAPKKLSSKQIGKICNRAIKGFKGNTANLNSAMGMLHLGNRIGWRPLWIMFDKKTIRRNEKILGISFKEVLLEEGDMAYKSVAWTVYKQLKISNFWRVVSGDIKNIKTPNFEEEAKKVTKSPFKGDINSLNN